MWLLLIFPVIVFILLVISNRPLKKWDSDEIGICFILCIISCCVAGIVSTALPVDYELTKKEYHIENLEDNIFVYSFQHENTYSFYYETEDGTFKLKEIDVDNAEIVYTKDQPRVIETYYVEIDNIYNQFANDKCPKNDINYLIYVPEGSISNSYTLDNH
jgi:hypothetical protein